MIKRPVGSISADGVFTPASPGVPLPPDSTEAETPYASSMRDFLKFALNKSLAAASASPFGASLPSQPLPPPGDSANSPLPQSSLMHGAGTLFYGGQVTKSPYNIGCKPERATTFKKQKRYELIARMENAALPEAQIAALLSLSVGRLRVLKQHPDYLSARMRITLGIIIDVDADLDQIREQRKDFLIKNLPAALQVIANAVHTPPSNLAEKKFQLAAAQDMLDREGTYAKISRSEIKPVDSFDWGTSDSAAQKAVDVIKGTLRVSQSRERGSSASGEGPVFGGSSPEAKERIEKIIEITRHFSNGSTINPFDQQAALEELEKKAL